MRNPVEKGETNKGFETRIRRFLRRVNGHFFDSWEALCVGLELVRCTCSVHGIIGLGREMAFYEYFGEVENANTAI